MDSISSINLYFFHLLNNLVGKSVFFDASIIFFGKYYISILILVMIVFIWIDFKKNSRKRSIIDFVALILTLLSVLLVTKITHSFYDHARPLFTLDIQSLLTETSNSFPSGHTIFIFGMATAAYFYSKKLSYFLFVSGILVGLARVAAGVHYPADILGGAFLGITIGIVIESVCRRLYPDKEKTNPQSF